MTCAADDMMTSITTLGVLVLFLSIPYLLTLSILFKLFYIGKVDGSVQTATKRYCKVLQDLEGHETLHTTTGENMSSSHRIPRV